MSKDRHDPDMVGDHIKPSPSAATRGPDARERRRRGLGKQRVTIRLDTDVVEEFKGLAPCGRGYQKLINQALREWLTARSVSGLVQAEIRQAFEEANETLSKKISVASSSSSAG